MENPTYLRTLAEMAVWATLVMGTVVSAQESSLPPHAPTAPTQLFREEAQKDKAAPCLEPPPEMRWEDYQGKIGKSIGMFARNLERKSVHSPHYKPRAVLCTLEPKDKFLLFVHNTVNPSTFIEIAYDAGIGQAENSDPIYTQGAAGYGKRLGAGFAGRASSEFFKDFAYPTIFSEDPRYYRLTQGNKGVRLLHATSHVLIAHGEDDTHMFNFSEWLGTSSTVLLSNAYHPDYERGFTPATRRVGYSVLGDSGFDVLREFWPEIARKLKLPFRGQRELASRSSDSPRN